MVNVKGKRIIITGAAGGIGSELSRKFAQKGAKVVLVDINEVSLEKLAGTLGAYEVETAVVDITSEEAVKKFAADLLAKGDVDILINNAGIGMSAEMNEMNLTQWRLLLDINLWAPIYLMQAFMDHWKTRGTGQIVNVSSGQAYYRLPTWTAYAAIKLAIGAISESMYYELVRHGIHVSTVYPYMVNTGFYSDVDTDTLVGKLSMQLVPFYSDSPAKVADKIVNAVETKKRVEMVHWFNQIGRVLRATPFMDITQRVLSLFMLKDGRSPKNLDGLLLGGAIGHIQNGDVEVPNKLGFHMDEIMSGYHEFEKGHGESGQRPMHFKAHWGTDDLSRWLSPWSGEFMTNDLAGTVTIDGLCEDAPCTGVLEMRYFTEQKIRYVLNFEVEGEKYQYVGEKRDIKPWNLPTSHTTCYGALTRLSDNTVISKSITYFRFETLVEFLRSFEMGLKSA